MLMCSARGAKLSDLRLLGWGTESLSHTSPIVAETRAETEIEG